MTNITSTAKGGINWLNFGLWTVAVLLAVFYGFAGFMKLTQPLAALSASGMAFVDASPEWLVRFIGLAEVAGALGVILPTLTRIMPMLTPYAALGLSAIQVLAIIVHAARGETAATLPINLVALALSLFLFYGRWKMQPVASRS